MTTMTTAQQTPQAASLTFEENPKALYGYRTFRLRSKLWLPRSVDEVFPFFSDAHNLQALTPDTLSFEILTPAPIEMRAGTLIDYRLRLYGIPLSWKSEITVWDPPFRFVDEQRRGPYKLWKHEHTFVESNGGVELGDVVDYAPVIGGRPIDRLFVQRDLRKIFGYRTEKMIELFGS